MRAYPRASLEMEGGELYTVFDISSDEVNGAKVEHTFRKTGAGISFGNVEISTTFKIKNPSTPAERDWRGKVRNKEIGQIVLKYPDGTMDVIDGAFSKRSIASPIEGASDTTMEFIGVVS